MVVLVFLALIDLPNHVSISRPQLLGLGGSQSETLRSSDSELIPRFS